MLRVGIVGLGFMGMVHYLSFQRHPRVEVAAICTRDKRRRAGDWRGIQGNFGPVGLEMDLTGVATYGEIDQLLANDSIDLVDVTLPSALHADVTLQALSAGKHVFCEKPMALSVADCQQMTAAAQSAKRLLMIGHVLPFFPEYRWALEIVQSGQFGKLLGGDFKRVIADPNWLANYWEPAQVGGPMLDLHIHDAHFIRLLVGMPEAVTSWGQTRDGLAEHWHTHFDYGPQGPTLHAVSGTINQQGRSFNHGFEIQLERATLVFEFAVIGREGTYLCPPTLLAHNSNVERPQLPGGDPMDAFAEEISEVVRSVNNGTPRKALECQLAQDAIVLCQKQTESLKSRTRVVI